MLVGYFNALLQLQVFELLRQILPGCDLCETYEPAQDLGHGTSARDSDYVSIHTSRGFVGYMDAKKSHKAVSAAGPGFPDVLGASQLQPCVPEGEERDEQGQASSAKAAVVAPQPPLLRRPSVTGGGAGGVRKKYRGRCRRCGQRFGCVGAELNHVCFAGMSSLACRACGKEYEREQFLHRHCYEAEGGV
jgi:hypothetical protein